MKEKFKITVAGTGYVGLSISVLLAQNNNVTALDLIQEKVDLINQKKYIGLTNNIQRRRARHFTDLKNGRHDNHFLQKEYNIYGYRYSIKETS